jgi:hypothetical protein
MMRNLSLLGASMVVGLCLLEFLCRLFVPLPSPYAVPLELIVMDDRGFWTLAPAFRGVMDNGIDFRGKSLTVDDDGTRNVMCRQKNADIPRVFLVGDSQTFGQGLSDRETWASILQCRLRDAKFSGQIFNLGVPGVNIDTYVRRMLQVVPVLRKGDRVIVGVTWNDLHTFHEASAVDAARRVLGSLKQSGGVGGLEMRSSWTPRYLQKATWRYRTYRATGLLIPSFDGLKGFLESMQYSSALFHVSIKRLKELIYRWRPTEALSGKIPDGTFERNFTLLQLMRDRVVAAGGRFDVLFLPNRVFFDDVYYAAYSQGGRVFPQQDYPGYLGKKYCPRFGLDCVSAFPYLRASERDKHTFAFDGHFNEAGARNIGQGLARQLFGVMR